MTTKQSFEVTTLISSSVDKERNFDGNANKNKFFTKDINRIRKNPLYKGQLSYVKDVLLVDNPDITADAISERLDISTETAKLLLNDCEVYSQNKED